VSAEPFFTIAVPTYNRAHFLGDTLARILNQSFDDFELLISDNASTDDTAGVVAGCRDRRVRYVRQRATGSVIANWGYCVGHARGRWLVMHQDDDVLSPLFLERCHHAVLRHPEIVMYATDFGVKLDGDVDRLFAARLAGDGQLPLRHRWDLPQPRLIPGAQLAVLTLFRTTFVPPPQAVPLAIYRKHWTHIDTERLDYFMNPRIMCEGPVAYESMVGGMIRVHPGRFSSNTPGLFGRHVEKRLNDDILAFFERERIDWRGALRAICAELPASELASWLRENAAEPSVPGEVLGIVRGELERRGSDADEVPPPDVPLLQQRLLSLHKELRSLQLEYARYRGASLHRWADRCTGWYRAFIRRRA
jgi:glycosyltransferase involved in cell wall biosynthesis